MNEMPPVIEERMAELLALCEEFGVARLEIFGSATTGAFDPLLSDLDFLVTYPPDYDYGPWLGRYFELKERLRELFRRRVDLVMAREFRNPHFARSVHESRRLLYAA
jgi:predicted nucleotidyltransferase